MTDEQLRELLAVAVEAALAAAGVMRHYFGSTRLGLVQKDDGSPVTLADREAEAMIRERLLAAPSGPLDILGEEEGLSGSGTRQRWTVDPIDGTRSFVRGIPLFGSMIALEDTVDGRALLGVIHLPMLDVTLAGAPGLGCTRNGVPLQLPESVAIGDTIIAVGDVAQFTEAGREEDFRRLTARHGYVRAYTDCFGHSLVIAGQVGAMIDPALNPWDIRPTEALIEAAGGTAILAPSRVAGKIDALFGNRGLVADLDRVLRFSVR
ncbi:MAG TPA: inositol monophosphatase family protein [Steroidobacteraceae bacterium]|jgi:myo-inositol-1(or 4)-monophosphatase|nr:inositol monophosphatase family protein [Steroidobacteraceae bacterium]